MQRCSYASLATDHCSVRQLELCKRSLLFCLVRKAMLSVGTETNNHELWFASILSELQAKHRQTFQWNIYRVDQKFCFFWFLIISPSRKRLSCSPRESLEYYASCMSIVHGIISVLETSELTYLQAESIFIVMKQKKELESTTSKLIVKVITAAWYLFCIVLTIFSFIAVELLFRLKDRNYSGLQTKITSNKKAFITQLKLGSAVSYLSEKERWLSMRETYKVQ